MTNLISDEQICSCNDKTNKHGGYTFFIITFYFS